MRDDAIGRMLGARPFERLRRAEALIDRGASVLEPTTLARAQGESQISRPSRVRLKRRHTAGVKMSSVTLAGLPCTAYESWTA